jgi:uncharacterized SAM-binding protein YcdF (DUF218 family)
MSLYVEKLLPFFIYPLGLTLLLCIAALALSFGGRVRALRMSIALAVTLLWLASTPLIASLLTMSLENQTRSVPLESILPKDVVIVLGGGLAQPADLGSTGDRLMQTALLFRAGSDRVVQAAFLWRARKAHMVIVSGGNLPWTRASVSTPEASLAAKILVAYGVPADSVIVEGNSRTTHENAINTAAIFRERHFRSGLLVTSAFHMPRALASFRKAGLDVTAWPADLHNPYPLVSSVFDFVPNAGALTATTAAIKEWFGLAVYRLRGWA